MIKLIDLLNEAPIGTYTTIGDFEKGASYKDPRDRASVSHPVTVQKVKDMLKNTIVDFDFYFVNKPGLRKFAEKGRVPYEFIFKPQPDGLGLTHEELGDRTINSDNITVFFVGNTAADKIPMTAWTIVHRVGHAMNRTPQFQEYTNKILVFFAKHHAVNCGNPKCIMCANPRKTFKELTAQEKRMFQPKLQDEFTHKTDI